MREDVGYTVKGISDEKHKELLPDEILSIFTQKYVNIENPIKLIEVHFKQTADGIETEVTLGRSGIMKIYHGRGNGRLDAISNALQRHGILQYKILDYKEHSLTTGSNSKACAYVQIRMPNGVIVWGFRHPRRYHRCFCTCIVQCCKQSLDDAGKIIILFKKGQLHQYVAAPLL